MMNKLKTPIKTEKSKLWYFLTKTNTDYYKTLTQDITKYEIHMAIQHQQNDKSIGTDNLPPEIYKTCSKWFIPTLTNLFKRFNNNNDSFPSGWKTGIVALIYKSVGKKLLRNYRSIAILNTICKIWDTIMTNRISPILNLITKDNQCAYKAKRSTTDAILYTKQQFMKNEI